MLELRHLTKSYKTGETVTHALKNVNLIFPDTGFVSILGPSGSGKTTLLNIIGGLDRYDSGDLLVQGHSTKTFSQTDWDAYRNNSIGFIFQSYNLISHLSIVENVELGMRLSGVKRQERHRKAIAALKQVGLGAQIGKKPQQLSGGQMQRVAIARAIADDPQILLCDEPTGALDSVTSVQVMDLIKQFSRDRLVIMVTHNEELAHTYSTRIIRLKDGTIRADSDVNSAKREITGDPLTLPAAKQPTTRADSHQSASATLEPLQLRRTRMGYGSAIALSFTNMLTKKGRTFLTAFASSIGIISIAVVLSLSGGFQTQIDQTMSRTLGRYPVSVAQTAFDADSMAESASNNSSTMSRTKNVVSHSHFTAAKSQLEQTVHINHITQKYVDYVKKIRPSAASDITLQRATQLNVITKDSNGTVRPVSFTDQALTTDSSAQSSQSSQSSKSEKSSQPAQSSSLFEQSEQVSQQTRSSMGVASSVFPTPVNGKKGSFLRSNYDLLKGTWPSKATDVVLVVDGNDEIPTSTLQALGISAKDGQKLSFDSILSKDFRIVTNNDWYQRLPIGTFVPRTPSADMFNQASLRLKVTGVIQPKPRGAMELLSPGIAYSNDLTDKIIAADSTSQIVTAQKASQTNVITGQTMTDQARSQFLATIGGSSLPTSLLIYPTNFESKDKVLSYLDAWNKGKKKADQIKYTDMSGIVTDLTGGLISGITSVLIAFAAISLITSMLMIGILTYTSVIERTKEIGVLKALGARKRDVTRVFDSETFLLGIFSGMLGVAIAYLLDIPINIALYNLTGLVNVAVLDPRSALILILVSTILTLISGHIPARMAARRDAAVALRSE